MAERVVSPGVFTNEIDQSFLPAAISQLGAALIGTCTKGPAFVPTVVNDYQDFQLKFGGLHEEHFLPYAAKSYLKSSGVATVVRVLGTTGFNATEALVLLNSDSESIAVVYPSGSTEFNAAHTFHDTQTTVTDCGDVVGSVASSFCINWGGSVGTDQFNQTMSLTQNTSSFIGNSIGTDVQSDKNGVAAAGQPTGYLAMWYPHAIASMSSATVAAVQKVTDVTETQAFGAWSAATTPYIVSQTGSAATALETTNETNLFKFETLSAGIASNREIKIGITNIQKAGQIAGSDYGSFDVIVRKFDDTDNRPQTLETFAGCNLDPNSSNFVVRRIGDMKQTFNTGTSKVDVTGDFPNMSKYIRLSDISQGLTAGTLGKDLVPWGHGVYSSPIKGTGCLAPEFFFQLHQIADDGEVSAKIFPGAAFDSGSTSLTGPSKDNLNWFNRLPGTPNTTQTSSIRNTSFHGSGAFRLDLVDSGSERTNTTNLDSALSTKKFIVGFQGGDDGFDPRFFGASGSGKWSSTTDAYDSGSFYDALATISNPDEIDINMIVTPGVNKTDHGKIVDKSLLIAEDRADAFVPFDAGNYSSTITDVNDKVKTMDNNFASTYYPWVKIFDDENNKHVWVPPSVVIPGVIAFNDKVAHPWFAPAGLNRGGLTEVTMAKERLTHSERDTLYEGRVNPIASFPGEGVVVWGQKTLQAKPSALDRVNVRRLLIAVKKFIASSSRYLVFEQNTESTRQRFLNIVNPYMEQVQANSGLTAFKVVMDGSNNTPDVVDRNELRGSIFVQPARTAEFIVLDFVVMPTGATFPE